MTSTAAHSFTFSPYKLRLVVDSDDGTTKAVDSLAGTHVLQPPDHSRPVNTTMFTPNVRFTASTAAEKLVVL